MAESIKLTKLQDAKIYCIKYGHANYIWNFFGYVHCGRCSEQIGDTLCSVFSTTNMIVVRHECPKCNTLKKKLSSLDKKILSRLEKNKDSIYDYEKILSGINLIELGVIP